MNILIIGATGTLGRALIKHYYGKNHKLFCFSRDELKQKDLKDRFPGIECILGNIGDGFYNSYMPSKIDMIYHVAALKHIDVLEKNVIETLKNNVQGTINVADFAIRNKVPRVAFSSTDKAVFPINVYGHSKALCEKHLTHLNEIQNDTKFHIFRWGNVIASRGSVIPYFVDTLLKEKKIYLTNLFMSRFWIKIEDAVSFMVEQMESPNEEKIKIPKMKAAKVIDVARAIAKKLDIPDFDVEMIGLRPGEKIHESITEELSSYNGPKYSKDELEELIASFI